MSQLAHANTDVQLSPSAACRIDEMEAKVAKIDRSSTPAEATAVAPPVVSSDAKADAGAAPAPATAEDGKAQELMAQRVRDIEAREKAMQNRETKDKEVKGKEAKEQQALKLKVCAVNFTCMAHHLGNTVLRAEAGNTWVHSYIDHATILSM